MEKLQFLTEDQARQVRTEFGTPAFVYSEARLRKRAQEAMAFPHAFGLTVRYAMKAAPTRAILQIFDDCGLHIDASSGWEAKRAISAGIAPEKIVISSQEFPGGFDELIQAGVGFNACSLDQLAKYGERFPGTRLGLRFNPGIGSGGTKKTNVGGPASSFGIWHEHADKAEALLERHGLTAIRIHTHIGSGSDPAVWERVAALSLHLVRRFPDVETLDLGGGYKVGRTVEETSTDLQEIGKPCKEEFEKFAAETGRKIKLEIEPGTYLVAMAASLVTTVQDAATTGDGGYRFLKLDSGMTELLRPSLYGSQHPTIIVPETTRAAVADYVIVGHCCESGDLVTPLRDEAETLGPRTLTEAAIGDLCVIEGVGAYCASMSAKNYNSFPEAPEVLLTVDGELRLIRRRQTLEQITQNEIALA